MRNRPARAGGVFGTPKGRMGVMAGHTVIVAAIAEGTVDICEGGEWKTAAVDRE